MSYLGRSYDYDIRKKKNNLRTSYLEILRLINKSNTLIEQIYTLVNPNSLIEINIDLIESLRNKGFMYEANRLIEAHQYSLKKNRQQTRKEIIHCCHRISYYKKKMRKHEHENQ